MQTDPLTPRDLYDNVDFYRNMRMNLDSDGGGNVWRYKHARNIIHIRRIWSPKSIETEPPSARNSDSPVPNWTLPDDWIASWRY